jgi:bifunctional pyridoxal-dependent enzyme with beta-cystathionase and maltose regulon repressor activities
LKGVFRLSVKREKFERLAERRVTEAVKKLRLIGNLANTNNYDYTGEHVAQILAALETEIQLLKNRFTEAKPADAYAFKFKPPRKQ